MRIEHVAIWTKDLEKMKSFYEKFFNGIANKKYVNEKKHFHSYFLTFKTGARLELMQKPELTELEPAEYYGITHFAFSVGSEEKVNDLTDRLKKEGFQVLDGPRTTGDGYYESLVLDPEMNRLEITI
ncbi:VOC family protein [Paenibacillus pinihumi]|uniref:VOC family protein n=1 Tax=Paenibacillus pinihumi TaxID=669462 RepID=UPI00048E3495|nr:VOC family protein [Paenibacillus pinihumi]